MTRLMKAEPLFERDMAAGRRYGWNACRAAMLARPVGDE